MLQGSRRNHTDTGTHLPLLAAKQTRQPNITLHSAACIGRDGHVHLKLPPCFWGYLVVWSALERLCFYKADWRYLRKLKTRRCFGPFKSSSYITEIKLFPFSKAILAVWALHPQFRLYGVTLSAEILSWLRALSSHSILPPPLGSAEQFLHPSPEGTKGEEAFRDQLHWGSSHLHPRQDSSQIPFSGVSLVSWCLTPGLHEFSKIHLFL